MHLYINIKINGNKQRDKETTTNAVRYRIKEVHLLVIRISVLSKCTVQQLKKRKNKLWKTFHFKVFYIYK